MKAFAKLSYLIIMTMAVQNLTAATARLVSHNSAADFEKGTVDGVSVMADGSITLAPEIARLIDTGDPFVWDIVRDSKGNIYAATGNDGRLYKTSLSGDSTLFFDAKELEIFALEIDKKNNIYAATFPNGRIYKIDPNGHPSVFFDPEDAYIWDIRIDDKNNLYVATGQKARIYKVSPDGSAEAILVSEQKHIRSLALGKDGIIYAGSSGKGYVYKLVPGQDPYVLFDTQLDEVHDLAVTGDGSTIFAAAIGTTSFGAPGGVQQGGSNQTSQNDQSQGDSQDEVTLSPQSIVPETLFRQSQKTSLFKIDQHGYARDLWMDKQSQVLQLLSDHKDNLWIGTGTRGNVYQMNKKGEISLLFSLEESQVTALSVAGNDLLVGTSSMGRCYHVAEKVMASGTFESEPIDAGNISRWGILSWEGSASDTNVKIFTRSGNTEHPGEAWSEWAPLKKEIDVYRVASPAARFIQWKCELSRSSQPAKIEKVTISYLQENLAPNVTAVVIHRPGEYYAPKENSSSRSTKSGGIVFPQPLSQSETKKGYRSVDWLFEDPNFDAIKFNVYYRKVGNTMWKELASDLETSVYSWDSTLMEDGEYEIKVVASDEPSNPKSTTLSHEKISDPFIIDNSGPQITSLQNKKVLTVKVADQFSTIKSFHYSIDAKESMEIYSDDGINDSKEETFSITLPADRSQESSVTIKAFDSLDNVTVKHISLK